MGGWALRALGEAGRVRRERGGLAAVDPLLGPPCANTSSSVPGYFARLPRQGKRRGDGTGFPRGIARASSTLPSNRCIPPLGHAVLRSLQSWKGGQPCLSPTAAGRRYSWPLLVHYPGQRGLNQDMGVEDVRKSFRREDTGTPCRLPL